MKKVLKLAEKIKDEKLRKKVIEMFENPELSNREIIYPSSEHEKIPSSLGAHHSKEGEHIEHVISVTELAIKMAENFEKMYSVKINYDYLIAGALLHDWGKIYHFTKTQGVWAHSGCTIDHAVLTACELYARGFPEEVIHIVEAHGGDLGQVAARPQTLEALIVFYADVVDSAVESFIRPSEQPKIFIIPEGE